jgi:AcrR family transcriptional regulator
MGYRGKVFEQRKARELRTLAWTLDEIAAELGVSKSSVSHWVRDVEFDETCWRARQAGRAVARHRVPNVLERRKQAEIDELLEDGRQTVGTLSERELLVAGTALYAGEGAKTDGKVAFANSDPRMIVLFCTWLRRFFDVDEERLRLRLYLHENLDLEGANRFWSELTGIPTSQFERPYRAPDDHTIRRAKHVHGCPSVILSCSRTHRAIMGLVHALLSCDAIPG